MIKVKSLLGQPSDAANPSLRNHPNYRQLRIQPHHSHVNSSLPSDPRFNTHNSPVLPNLPPNYHLPKNYSNPSLGQIGKYSLSQDSSPIKLQHRQANSVTRLRPQIRPEYSNLLSESSISGPQQNAKHYSESNLRTVTEAPQPIPFMPMIKKKKRAKMGKFQGYIENKLNQQNALMLKLVDNVARNNHDSSQYERIKSNLDKISNTTGTSRALSDIQHTINQQKLMKDRNERSENRGIIDEGYKKKFDDYRQKNNSMNNIMLTFLLADMLKSKGSSDDSPKKKRKQKKYPDGPYPQMMGVPYGGYPQGPYSQMHTPYPYQQSPYPQAPQGQNGQKRMSKILKARKKDSSNTGSNQNSDVSDSESQTTEAVNKTKRKQRKSVVLNV